MSFVGITYSIGSHIHLIRSTHCRSIISEDREKTLDEDLEIEAMFLINSNNPIGQCFAKLELEEIAHLAIERDLFAIIDEIFHKFILIVRRGL